MVMILLIKTLQSIHFRTHDKLKERKKKALGSIFFRKTLN